MDNIQWSDKLSVGVGSIDAEHKKLINLVNELNQHILVGSRNEAAGNALSGLIDYTVTHFKNEEDLMKKHGYPGYPNHKTEHEKLTAKVLDFKDRYVSGKTGFTIELIKFLQDWLINHIEGTDMAYKKFFMDKGVS